MSITTDTQTKTQAARIELDKHLDEATRKLAEQWGVAWHEISAEWAAALDELLSHVDAGEWPTQGQIARATRAQRALAVTAEKLEKLNKQAGVTITGSLKDIAEHAAKVQRDLALTQAPLTLTAGELAASIDWARVNAKALDAIVKRTTRQVESSLRPLPREQQQVMKSALIRGVAAGESPRETAATMLRRLNGVFDGGRQRAEVIARTEMIDAHRAAAHASMKANRDLLSGWEWSCEHGPRSCGACLAMDGKRFGVDEPGPLGHQCCRCSALAVLKTWKELGFDGIEEPDKTRKLGPEWFDEQSPATQKQILGAKRLKALRDGDLTWDQMAVRRSTDGWRNSYALRPLADL